MIVQIYEIQTPDQAEKCIEFGVNHIGSVLLSQDAWRVFEIRETIRLTQGAGAKSTLIPLFLEKETTCRAIDYYRPDFIHFCDSLTDGEGKLTGVTPAIRLQQALKERFPEVGIMRSIPMPRQGADPGFPSLEIARMLRGVSDVLLIDTWVRDAPEDGYIGITGQLADQKASRTLVRESTIPVILAGGLSPENVYEAIMAVRPSGVDSCTQTNQVSEDKNPVRFQKDFRKVEAFVGEVRRAEMALQGEKAQLIKKLEKLREDLKDREAALPAHSIRPNQILAIEALEDEIEAVEKALEAYP
jgi:phosphoribosylanthranilate isomerase